LTYNPRNRRYKELEPFSNPEEKINNESFYSESATIPEEKTSNIKSIKKPSKVC
jgi:hypothetical protein